MLLLFWVDVTSDPSFFCLSLSAIARIDRRCLPSLLFLFLLWKKKIVALHLWMPPRRCFMVRLLCSPLTFSNQKTDKAKQQARKRNGQKGGRTRRATTRRVDTVAWWQLQVCSVVHCVCRREHAVVLVWSTLTVKPMPTVAANEDGWNVPVSNWTRSEVLPTPLSPTKIVYNGNAGRTEFILDSNPTDRLSCLNWFLNTIPCEEFLRLMDHSIAARCAWERCILCIPCR